MQLNECAELHPSAKPAANSIVATPSANADANNPGKNADNAEAIPDSERYSRQVLFSGIGAAGQQQLAASHVAIVGCGAMGAASASSAASATCGSAMCFA